MDKKKQNTSSLLKEMSSSMAVITALFGFGDTINDLSDVDKKYVCEKLEILGDAIGDFQDILESEIGRGE